MHFVYTHTYSYRQRVEGIMDENTFYNINNKKIRNKFNKMQKIPYEEIIKNTAQDTKQNFVKWEDLSVFPPGKKSEHHKGYQFSICNKTFQQTSPPHSTTR